VPVKSTKGKVMISNMEELMGPAKKLTELNRARVEKAVEAQQLAAQEYMVLAEAQFKAAVDIKDMPSLKTFMAGQLECVQSSVEKIVADSKALLEAAKSYNEEVIRLLQEGNKMMVLETTETVNKTAKKAA